MRTTSSSSRAKATQTTGGTPGLAMISTTSSSCSTTRTGAGASSRRTTRRHAVAHAAAQRGTGPFTQAPNVPRDLEDRRAGDHPRGQRRSECGDRHDTRRRRRLPRGHRALDVAGRGGSAFTNGELSIWYSRNNVGMLDQPPSAQVGAPRSERDPGAERDPIFLGRHADRRRPGARRRLHACAGESCTATCTSPGGRGSAFRGRRRTTRARR